MARPNNDYRHRQFCIYLIIISTTSTRWPVAKSQNTIPYQQQLYVSNAIYQDNTTSTILASPKSDRHTSQLSSDKRSREPSDQTIPMNEIYNLIKRNNFANKPQGDRWSKSIPPNHKNTTEIYQLTKRTSATNNHDSQQKSIENNETRQSLFDLTNNNDHIMKDQQQSQQNHHTKDGKSLWDARDSSNIARSSSNWSPVTDKQEMINELHNDHNNSNDYSNDQINQNQLSNGGIDNNLERLSSSLDGPQIDNLNMQNAHIEPVNNQIPLDTNQVNQIQQQINLMANNNPRLQLATIHDILTRRDSLGLANQQTTSKQQQFPSSSSTNDRMILSYLQEILRKEIARQEQEKTHKLLLSNLINKSVGQPGALVSSDSSLTATQSPRVPATTSASTILQQYNQQQNSESALIDGNESGSILQQIGDWFWPSRTNVYKGPERGQVGPNKRNTLRKSTKPSLTRPLKSRFHEIHSSQDLMPLDTFRKFRRPLAANQDDEEEEDGETELNLRFFNNFSRMGPFSGLQKSGGVLALVISLAFLILSNVSLATTLIAHGIYNYLRQSNDEPSLDSNRRLFRPWTKFLPAKRPSQVHKNSHGSNTVAAATKIEPTMQYQPSSSSPITTTSAPPPPTTTVTTLAPNKTLLDQKIESYGDNWL